VHNYYRTTLAHNTLFADEKQQAGDADLEWRPDADPPMARGIITDKDGIRYQRTVFFVSSYIVVLDEYAAEQEHRFGWVFHAEGKVNITSPLKGPEDVGALVLPSFPEDGEYAMFTNRRSGTSTGMLSAIWNTGGGVSLKMLTVSDSPFEVTAGRTPGQPIMDDFGCVLLRAPGDNRRFATVFEPTKGALTVKSISMEGDTVTVLLNGGVKQAFKWV
jgi:hypothetical protein